MFQKTSAVKINGFSRGFNLHQISSYMVLLASIFFFSFVIVPNFITSLQVTLSFLYYLPSFAVIFFGYMATTIDPTDEAVITERKCRLAGKPFDGSSYLFQCDYCGTSVHEDSKHCRTCDRCVSDFDHHCNWINNCVSKKNYRHFFAAIVGLLLSTSFFMLAGLLFIIDYFAENIGVIKNLQNMNNQEWKPIVMSVLTGISAIFWALLLKLIIFHIYLIRHSLTTYEYIVEKKQLKKAQEKNKKVSKPKNRKILPFSTGKSKDLEVQSQKPSSAAEIDDHHTSDRHSIPEMRRSGKSHTNTRRGSRTGLSDANLTVERENTKYFTKSLKPEGLFDQGHYIISGGSSPNYNHGDQYTFGGEKETPRVNFEDESPKLRLTKEIKVPTLMISPFGSNGNLHHCDNTSVETPLTISKNASTFLIEKKNKGKNNLRKNSAEISPTYLKGEKEQIDNQILQSCPETEERYLKRNTETEIADIISSHSGTKPVAVAEEQQP